MTALARMLVTRDTAAGFTSDDPVLRVGEMGIETDTDKMKIGDGITAWSGLAYVAGGGSVTQEAILTDEDGNFLADESNNLLALLVSV